MIIKSLQNEGVRGQLFRHPNCLRKNVRGSLKCARTRGCWSFVEGEEDKAPLYTKLMCPEHIFQSH